MAGCIVSLVIARLSDLLLNEAFFLSEVGEEVGWMERELRRMQCFLRDAEEKQETDAMVMNWVREVREVACEVEDVIDNFVLRFGKRPQRSSSFRNSFKRYARIPFDLYARHDIDKEIQTIKSKIREISESRATYGIESLHGESQAGRSSDENLREPRRPAVYCDDADVVGFEKDMEKLLKLLLGIERRRMVVSIVGMGGLGKTTLAKKVFNSISSGGFGCCVWINLSQEYKPSNLLQEIARKAMAIEKKGAEKMDREELGEKLYRFLENKRYLIVLDDVRETDIWDAIKSHLPDVRNGSRVMITTRYRNTATYAVPCFPPHELQVLNVDEGWQLLVKKAFPNQAEIKSVVCSRELMTVGQRIVNNCGGLPLALVVLGGLLSGKDRTPGAWLKALEGINWQQTEPGKQCLDILALSYNDLPYHLKWCFLYFSSFPEAYEVDAGKLIRMWIAEGFVRKCEGEALEETGERFLVELIQRCLVRVVAKSLHGNVQTCRIHDLLHDLSISKSKEVNFFHVNGQAADHEPVPSTARRLAVHKSVGSSIFSPGSTQNIRTLLDFSGSYVDFRMSKLLRVLDLEGTLIQNLPGEIGDMIHLRYLGLRETKLRKLPTSMSDLYNLQSLDVRNTDIDHLPDGVWNIKTLRHVYGNWLDKPQSIGGGDSSSSRSYLQTLDSVAAGPWIQNSLARLTNLCTLWIFGFEADKSYARSLTASLAKLHHLNTLLLSAGEGPLPIDLLNAFLNLQHLRVLSLRGSLARAHECHELPGNLIKVCLKSTKLNRSFWEALENLQFLRILMLDKDSYADPQLVCSSGGFPQLQELFLENLDKLVDWRVEEKAMSCLKYLCINRCHALKGLPAGLRHVVTLQKLELKGMSPSFSNMVRNQDRKKIQHITSVTINGSMEQ